MQRTNEFEEATERCGFEAVNSQNFKLLWIWLHSPATWTLRPPFQTSALSTPVNFMQISAKKSKRAADSACPDHAPAVTPGGSEIRVALTKSWLGLGMAGDLESSLKLRSWLYSYKVMRFFGRKYLVLKNIWVWVNTGVQYDTIRYNMVQRTTELVIQYQTSHFGGLMILTKSNNYCTLTNKGFLPSSLTCNKPSWWDMLGHVHTLCACPAPPQPRLQHLVRSTCSSASGFGVQDTHLAAVACDDPAHLHLLICDFGFCYTCILDAWGLSKSRSMIIMINDF